MIHFCSICHSVSTYLERYNIAEGRVLWCARNADRFGSDRISHALGWVNKGEEKELSFAAYLFSRREIPQYSINEHHPPLHITQAHNNSAPSTFVSLAGSHCLVIARIIRAK